MTEHNGNEDKGFEDSSREERINALLDGDLDPDEAETLKAMATQDKDLMRAIVEAYQLQRAMEHVRVEKAPARLRRRLKQIPRQNRAVYLQPRWVAAFAPPSRLHYHSPAMRGAPWRAPVGAGRP